MTAALKKELSDIKNQFLIYIIISIIKATITNINISTLIINSIIITSIKISETFIIIIDLILEAV